MSEFYIVYLTRICKTMDSTCCIGLFAFHLYLGKTWHTFWSPQFYGWTYQHTINIYENFRRDRWILKDIDIQWKNIMLLFDVDYIINWWTMNIYSIKIWTSCTIFTISCMWFTFDNLLALAWGRNYCKRVYLSFIQRKSPEIVCIPDVTFKFVDLTCPKLASKTPN